MTQVWRKRNAFQGRIPERVAAESKIIIGRGNYNVMQLRAVRKRGIGDLEHISKIEITGDTGTTERVRTDIKDR